MHDKFLRRCLELAGQARGKTGINPMVGAVLVRDGKIIAEGFHQEFGKPHAERQLLQKYEYKIRSTDTVYVNLEPCCHTNKKTPPCAQMLIEKCVKNVVIGMQDPNPEVSGKGITLLCSHGVNVSICTELTADCLRLNRGYISLQTKGRPWITLKQAMTSEKKYANADGSPLKITSPEQDEWSHRLLRARHDAILVGIGTILKDDPQLTARYSLASPHPRPHPPAPAEAAGRGEQFRIILDPTLKIPLTAKVMQGNLAFKTIVVAATGFNSNKVKELESRGVTLFEIPLNKHMFDWEVLWDELTTPKEDFYGISSILVEGGLRTWEMFRKAGMVDEEVTLVG